MRKKVRKPFIRLIVISFISLQIMSVVAFKIFYDLRKASHSANKVLPEKAGSGNFFS
jgi:hypothetical protein